MGKRISPYTRLLHQAREYIYSIKHPHAVGMWVYPKNRLSQNWKLEDLYLKVKTADELGYRVELTATDQGLEVDYIKKPADIPYNFRY